MENREKTQDAVRLFRKRFEKEIQAENYKYKHFANPFRMEVPVVYEYRNEKMVGMYGCMRQEMQQNGQRFFGVYCCDVVIDPDHKNGVYFALLAAVLQQCQGQASFIVMQRPSPVHAFILENIGFENAGKVCTMELQRADFCPMKARMEDQADLRVEVTENFPFSAQDIREIAASFNIGVHRTREYFQWKVDNNPYRKMFYCVLRSGSELAGYFVAEAEKEVLRIVDWIAAGPFGKIAFSALLERCLQIFSFVRCVKIKCVNTENGEQNQLAKLGFTAVKYQNIYWLGLDSQKPPLFLCDWTMRELDEDGMLQKLKNADERHIFVSPHYDDAVGGCGARIHDLVMQGKDVTVVTVFGGVAGSTMSAYARKLHNKWGITDCRQREQEDEEACKVLACKRRSMPFKDAIYRQAPDGHFLYDTSDSLFEDMCSEDGALLEKLLEIFLGEYKAGDTYYFPMAKGGHVDHRIVNLAGMELVKRGCIVIFYKEFFYKSSVDAAESCSIYEFSEATLVKKIEAMMKYQSQLPVLYKEQMEEQLRKKLAEENLDIQTGKYIEMYKSHC